jgi:nitric oxide reductase subunit B
MDSMRKLWVGLALVFCLSLAVLGWMGREIYLAAPPIPELIRTSGGETLYSGEQVQNGQRAWLSAGGQQLGSVWGHGAYVAPDWSADWLHREALAYRALKARELYQTEYEFLTPTQRGAVDAIVREELRANTGGDAVDAGDAQVLLHRDRAGTARGRLPLVTQRSQGKG